MRKIQPILGLLATGLTLGAYAEAAMAQNAIEQNSTEVEAAQNVTDIPVQPSTEPPLEPLPENTDAGTIQVPNIVPIPPRPIPIGPLAPLPGTLPGDSGRPEDDYVLGPGDQIVVDIFDVPEFSGEAGTYTILVDGSVIFPWIGRVRLQGQTLTSAAELLEREYGGRGFIRSPIITVNLLTPRDLTISVVGQVKRPGAYAIAPTGEIGDSALVGAGGGGGAGGNQWPTVTQAIQAAQGITQLADLRNVQIRRPFSDGSEQLINVNLWELIRSGQLNQDITLRDGDSIVVPTAVALSPDEALLTGSASFAPASIQVNVVGEVIAPGLVEVPPNTPLNQAIQAAGGFDARRARRGRVELIRLNSNGTAVRRSIETDLAAGVNEESNPPLQEGDVIVVRRSTLTSVTDTLSTILDPVGTVLGTLDIFGIFDAE